MNKQNIDEAVKKLRALSSDCIKTIMMPLSSIASLCLSDNKETVLQKVQKSKRTFYPVYNIDQENVVGIIHVKDLLINTLKSSEIDIIDGMHEPIYFNENTGIRQAYDIFNQSHTGAAFVVDKKNVITGFITLKDITKAFLSILQLNEDIVKPYYIQQADGSWLVEGIMPVCGFIKTFNIESQNDEEKQSSITLSEFIVDYLGKMPSLTESFEFRGYSLEITEVENNSIKTVLIKVN